MTSAGGPFFVSPLTIDGVAVVATATCPAAMTAIGGTYDVEVCYIENWAGLLLIPGEANPAIGALQCNILGIGSAVFGVFVPSGSVDRLVTTTLGASTFSINVTPDPASAICLARPFCGTASWEVQVQPTVFCQ